jgi:hypothetical protein
MHPRAGGTQPRRAGVEQGIDRHVAGPRQHASARRPDACAPRQDGAGHRAPRSRALARCVRAAPGWSPPSGATPLRVGGMHVRVGGMHVRVGGMHVRVGGMHPPVAGDFRTAREVSAPRTGPPRGTETQAGSGRGP